ncbi:anaerobic C4-dicarboxylate transporter DcuA [Capnocytophaga granulosa]|uniref:Anaerobic C4-dicarboxylate transporter DcuA n=1 Tax=Capnocytophaga granulosa TaxID=45242 RepID=A0A1H2YMT6_9FLAO|nr:anaerobic C4-dicarboxylate transporter [Capnocytophaga granulosa]EPD27510.1 anaerobic C4-dicarboxylate uptake (Dcu) family transporter [Capnocytophaga granulosa ATCC 51502]SDX06496.1 anaerobic C4-dicarboxylate transporter DcuA [Capnocytophaga granulosa]SUX18636.1 Anaerobic C4-dicarboxylate transporter DcuA [Capnocytophaga granulosa]
MIYMELLVVLAAIFIGARVGGIGLGIFGMMGLGVLVFGFGLKPGNPPIDVMLIIVAVITAAATLQAAGGLDYLVKVAEKILRRNPAMITFLAPVVCYFFTLFSGTGHIAYSLLPIISEIATDSKVRPERPLSISVIASQQAITASPISAATAALLSAELLGDRGITLGNILMVCIPATLIGVIAGAIAVNFVGVPLEKDPEYLRRIQEGILSQDKSEKAVPSPEEQKRAKTSVIIFLLGVFSIVLFGSVEALRPTFTIDGKAVQLGMTQTIEIVMMSTAGLMLILSKADINKAVKGSVFIAGMQAVIAIFGIAWMGDTYFNGNIEFFKDHIAEIVNQYPFLFAVALFVMSIFLFSQAATVRTLYPLGLGLGISPLAMVAMFPAVNGYFFIPNYPTVVAAINFDRTGTTHIGKYVLNHSFQLPGFVATIVAIAVGYTIIAFM